MCTSLCLMLLVLIICCVLILCQSALSLCNLHAWAPLSLSLSLTHTHAHAQPYIQFRLGSVSPYVPHKIPRDMIDASMSQCCSSVWVPSFLYHPSPLQYPLIKYLSPHSHMICLRGHFQLTLSSGSKGKNMRGNELEHNRTWSSAGNVVGADKGEE